MCCWSAVGLVTIISIRIVPCKNDRGLITLFKMFPVDPYNYIAVHEFSIDNYNINKKCFFVVMTLKVTNAGLFSTSCSVQTQCMSIDKGTINT